MTGTCWIQASIARYSAAKVELKGQPLQRAEAVTMRYVAEFPLVLAMRRSASKAKNGR